jgi:hypothetical protein
MMNIYEVPQERRPKRVRVRKNGRTGRPELVMEYDDGVVAVVTHEEMQARAKRARDGKGLRS